MSNYQYSALVVDDEQINRDLLGEYLGSLGIEYLEAINGLIGYNQAKQHNPDIILLDINMPRGDGLSMLKKLRETKLNMPVIMVTSDNSPEHVKEAIDLGANDYIIKPIKIDILKSKLERHLAIKL